jgi:hypothetical protein
MAMNPESRGLIAQIGIECIKPAMNKVFGRDHGT